jgi:geranyl-CoA carboxylase alpha subunit
VLEVSREYEQALKNSVIVSPNLRNWSSASPLVTRKHYVFGDQEHALSVSPSSATHYRVSSEQTSVEIELLSVEGSKAQFGIDGSQHTARFHSPNNGLLYLSIGGRDATFRDLIRLHGIEDKSAGGGAVSAPMHGVLLEVSVAAGDTVIEGQTLAVLEAMKMHYQIVAEVDGTVREVMAEAGRQVAADDLLIEIEVAD